MTEQISTIQKLIDTIIQFLVNYSFQVLGAVIILAIGSMVANWVSGIVFKILQKRNLDITLSKFLSTFAKIVIIAFAVIIALGNFGITIAPFVAALGAASFGASIAIQGPLSNYGAGFSIILSRPFSVGDTITVASVSGVVHDIKITSTLLVTEDGIEITIPNKHIVGEIVYNSKMNRMAEATVGISYESNPETAIAVITKAMNLFPEVSKNPAMQVGVQSFGDSAINIGYRYWVPTVKFFQVSYAVNLAVYKALSEAKINLPFPQREVRILEQPVKS